MNRHQSRNYYVLVASFIVAIILTIMPIPVQAEPFRPEWILLMVIYWSMTTPRMVAANASMSIAASI